MEEEKQVKVKKNNFFKKAWYSIFKLEKYGEMSAEGVPRAIGYLIKLALIIAIIMGINYVCEVNKKVTKLVSFVNEQVGDFSYKDGTLKLSEEKTVEAPSSIFGKIIINTNIENEEEINQHINMLNGEKGIILLKDKVLIKGGANTNAETYSYSDLMQKSNISELNKEQLLEYVDSSNLWKLYIAIFLFMLIYTLMIAFIPLLFNAVLLSIFGYLVTWFAKIKMRFAAVFNLAVYSLTLSVVLHSLYIAVNIFQEFTVKYFQIMYVGVAAIYLIAAILLIKSEFIKEQQKIKEEEKEIKDEEDKKEDPKEDKQDENKNKNEDKENGKKDDKKETGGEPELG